MPLPPLVVEALQAALDRIEGEDGVEFISLRRKLEAALACTIAVGPQPVSTAPQDCTALLTDCGIARPLTEGEKRWYSVSDANRYRWVHCYRSGVLVEDSDYGPDLCDPKLWTPLPDWMR
jgi:hypothetical protein